MKKFWKFLSLAILNPLFFVACGNNNNDGPVIPPYTGDVSLITYDNDTLKYDLSSIPGFDPNKLVVTSTDSSLFTVEKVTNSNNELIVESNLENKVGSAKIKFEYDGELLDYSINVAINYPQNYEEAMDAFTLAAIKLNNGEDDFISFPVTFNFNNNNSVFHFNESIEIYGRRGMFDYDYKTGAGVTNTFAVSTSQPFATKNSGISKSDNNYYFENLINLNYEYRKAMLKNHPTTLYIENINKTLDVENSEELFWAVEHGYRPIINNSTLLSLYQKALNICREVTNDEMNDFEKARMLFDKLNSITHYDHYVVTGYCTDDWWNYTSYFLEGVFNDSDYDSQPDGIAVCDGFSKAYALLCGIVNVPCIRSCGFTGDNSGHAWNYVKIENDWYLACPTWCKLDDNMSVISAFYDNDAVSAMNYTAFLASKNYFYEQSGEQFSDLTFPNTIVRSSNRYKESILSMDIIEGHSYYLHNKEDATALQKVAALATNRSYISLNIPIDLKDNLKSWCQEIIKGVTISLSKCSYVSMEESDYGFLSVWLLFAAN